MFKIRLQEWKRFNDEDYNVIDVLAVETRKVEIDGYNSKWKERRTFFLVWQDNQFIWIDGEDYEFILK